MRAVIITITTVAFILVGCSSSDKLIDPYPEPYVKVEPELKKPDWVKSTKIFWYDEKSNGFWAIGVAESSDPDLALAISKAMAAKNIAEFVQSQISSELRIKKGDELNSTQLLVDMITQKIKFSIVTVEYFTERYLSYGRSRYVIYTKNFITQNSLKHAIDEVLQNLR